MGMSAGALSSPLRRSGLSMAPWRQSVAMGLGRAAYALFYVLLALLVFGGPLAVGYLFWHWLTH